MQPLRIALPARFAHDFSAMHLPRFLRRWIERGTPQRAGRVLVLSARDFMRDNGPSWAAAIAYYSLLSLFPLLLALASLAAFFVEPQWAVQQATGYLGDLLPRGSAAIERVVQQTLADGREAGILFLLPLLWTGSLVFNAVTKALNIAFDAEERVSFAERVLMRLAMLLSLGGMFLAALASSFVLQWLRDTFGFLPGGWRWLFGLLIETLPVVFMLIAFFLAYRFVPWRRPHWRAALFGAVVAALLFACAKPLFLGYVRHLARYNVVYGSLAGIIVVVLWTWMVAMIGLLGGQIAAHSQRVFIRGRSVEDLERQHLGRSARRTPRAGPPGVT